MNFKLMTLTGLIAMAMLSCEKDNNTWVSENTWQPEIILEQTIQTNVEIMGTALNSVFITLLDDSVSRAEFTQTILQPLHYFESNEGFFFVETLNGYLIADPSLPDMLGTWRYNVQDINGVYLVRNMIDIARFATLGWTNYAFNNPATGLVEAKRSAVKLIPSANWFVASGYYESQVEAMSELTSTEYYDFMYRELVNTFAGVLVNLAQQYPPESDFFIDVAREMIHHARFGIDYSGYFFLYTMEGVIVAYGADAEMDGVDMINFQDVHGNYIVQYVIERLETAPSFYFDYDWENPTTGLIEHKRSYIKRLDDLNMYIGSGIYLEE